LPYRHHALEQDSALIDRLVGMAAQVVGQQRVARVAGFHRALAGLQPLDGWPCEAGVFGDGEGHAQPVRAAGEWNEPFAAQILVAADDDAMAVDRQPKGQRRHRPMMDADRLDVQAVLVQDVARTARLVIDHPGFEFAQPAEASLLFSGAGARHGAPAPAGGRVSG
jgi:hypothetical protein